MSTATDSLTHAALADKLLDDLEGYQLGASVLAAAAQVEATLAVWAELKRANDRHEREDRVRRTSI